MHQIAMSNTVVYLCKASLTVPGTGEALCMGGASHH
jgi:hypothetical protein